ncbi:hypothetical protein AVEN_223262-1 [Araneus ventricosus]|uniref:Uncharacterized protein n=1 Tax=Araneus ventricosus TaxID=182803 RepID=A0A4Y2NWM4_ARAVE|nr:hypothetical protein AVEN_223262-1 [Araneus ventricosus]
MQRSPPLSITKAHSTISTDALHVLSGCPPLDLKVRTDVITSRHIQLIKNSREIGDLQNFDFEMARDPWEVVKISWSLFDESQTFGNVIHILMARKSRTELGVPLFTSKKMMRFSHNYFGCLMRRQSLWLRLWQFGRLLLEDN